MESNVRRKEVLRLGVFKSRWSIITLYLVFYIFIIDTFMIRRIHVVTFCTVSSRH